LKSDKKILQLARQTFDTEAEAILKLKSLINADFAKSLKIIYSAKGRVVITGIGKSAIIANKIVATLNSTGTPSVFMHAADAIHGDLGIIQQNDIIVCISKSGNTPEIKVLVPLLKNGGNKLIAICGNMNSYLAEHADFVLDTTIEKEACPNNLAPTTSTTVQLAMGDALAVCLLEYRGFTSGDFAKYHPGGALGKKLYLRVNDLYKNNAQPKVKLSDSIKNVIFEISSNRLGAAAVIDNGKLAGIITDGDLRRMMENKKSFDSLQAKDIMTVKPKTADQNMMAFDALQLMKKYNITQLVVTDKNKYLGFVHLHDLLREGII
jgi:arabinose-5-phosphate isomerase